MSTIDYYDKNAEMYFDYTVNADMSDNYQRFLIYLPQNSFILDAGCGSGRDSRYFLTHGYKVKAIDGSKELCLLASEYIGQEVINIRFCDMDYINEFDGIWANASLLHVDKNKVKDIISRMGRALKPNGIFYASFKYGDSDRVQGERYYNDMNEDRIKELFSDFEILEIWMSDDALPGRSEKWVNIIVKNSNSK